MKTTTRQSGAGAGAASPAPPVTFSSSMRAFLLAAMLFRSADGFQAAHFATTNGAARPAAAPSSSSAAVGWRTHGATTALGMAAATKKGGKKKKQGGGGMGMGGGGGMGGAKGGKKQKKGGKNDAAPFDVSAALLRSERLYEKIVGDAARQLDSSTNDDDDNDNNDSDAYNFDSITTEYVIAARDSQSSSAAVSDWVPVAQMVTVRPVEDYSSGGAHDDTEHKDSIRVAVSANCRELHHAATLAAPVFKSVPRNDVQYGCEPLDSFFKFVYDDVIEGKTPGASSSAGAGGGGGGGDGAMTKSRARTVLDLEEGCSDMGIIKRAYRDKSFQLHPDRFVGAERTEEERRDASDEFERVKTSYEVLCSGVRGGGSSKGAGGDTSGGGGGSRQSWYESLGGRQRTEFHGPVEFKYSISKAQKTIEGLGGNSAVVGLDGETVMNFVARNQAAASGGVGASSS